MAQAKPLLLTGAAGNLGSLLRPRLSERSGGLRSTDIEPFGPPLPGEEIIQADLADPGAVDRLTDGVSAVVHFGAVGVEDSFDRILRNNIVATQMLFDAARLAGVKRIVYASSIHVVGLYPTSRVVDSEAPPRPDSYYAVSKVFGEALARLYVEKAGLEIACLRIGVVMDEPKTTRNLWTWLSVPDLLRLVDLCLDWPDLGFAVVYGVSNNDRRWWDNARSGIPFRPLDNAEAYAERIAASGGAMAPDDGLLRFHGGPFVALPLGQRPE